jgi:two-component system sensor kinase FixL
VSPDKWRRRTAGSHPIALLLAYGVAIGSVAAAVILTRVLNRPELLGPLIIPAVLVSAWFGGTGPGLVASALAVWAIDYFLLTPGDGPQIRNVDDAVYLLGFSVSAVFVAWLAGKQRRAEDALRAAYGELTIGVQNLERVNARLHEQASLLDLTHDTVFVRDMNDVIMYWNRGAAELYGWSAPEAVGKVSHELTRTIFPAPIETINAELHRTDRWEGEIVHTKRDGTRVTVASRWSLQRDQQGQPAAVLETNNDITEQKRASEALQEAHAELAHVTRVTMLGEITASIAHEVNQPLAAVVANGSAGLRWLSAEPPNVEEARAAVRRIIDDGNRASGVVGRIRSLLRKTATGQTELDVNEVIRETLTFMEREVERQRATVTTTLDDRIPRIIGDRVQLEQVLINVVLNALDAMTGVPVQTRVLQITSRFDGPATVVVEVQDHGTGFAPTDADRIFKAFYSTKQDGLGMGLSICKSIIEAHSGRLWATTNEGAGATLHIALPVPAGETT